MQLKEHERTFPIKPVGVKYICEYCNEGEMILIPTNNIQFLLPNDGSPLMRKHYCTSCNKEMILPKAYPYIEWVKE